MGKVKDLTGQKFGRLTVISRAEDYISPQGQCRTRWLCQCDCGNQCVVSSNNLRSETTKSCGCWNIEQGSMIGKQYGGKYSEIFRKFNKYEKQDNIIIGYTTKGETFFIDADDYDKIKSYCWYKTKQGYIVTDVHLNGKRETILLHRLITNCPKDKVVDHINHDTTDNRKCNLRNCNQSQNNANRIAPTYNSSGVRGVYHIQNSWIAHIDFEDVHLGKSFKTKEEAVAQRKLWEEKYFGEYNNIQMYVKE